MNRKYWQKLLHGTACNIHHPYDIFFHPLPNHASLPSVSHDRFEYTLLVIHWQIKISFVPNDTPFLIALYFFTDRLKEYYLITWGADLFSSFANMYVDFMLSISNFDTPITHTIQCCYEAVQYNKIMHTSVQVLRQNISQRLNPQKTAHISP